MKIRRITPARPHADAAVRQPCASGRTKTRWVARVPLLVASFAAQPRRLSRSKGIRETGTDQTYFPGRPPCVAQPHASES